MRVSVEKLHPSVSEAARRLREEYPGVPLVALGQTVFWDEPVKAGVFAALDALDPGSRRLRLGINDHDYFSKTAAPLPADEPFAILEHNDAATRDLWVATGEISMLFGSETIPTRDHLRRYGVEWEKVARDAPEGREAFLDRVTAAWGWRGIAQTGDRRQIAHEIRLAEILPWALDLLRWGFCESAGLLHGQEAWEHAAGLADEATDWLRRFDREHPDALLSDAYRDVHLRLFRLLTGREPDGVETFTSTDLLRLTPETAGLPRFAILDLFLRPATREIACRAYNHAVEGSQIYTLDRFGPGTIPFDLVVPGRGRGTIRVLPDGVAVATPDPIWIATERPVESAAGLAALAAERLGPEVSVVGKGVVFVCMINAEAMLVFHEGGSSYVSRTAKMLQEMADEGVPVPLYPILRVRHHTWDALVGAEFCFHLPEHLAGAFGEQNLCARDFGRRWREVVAEQQELLDRLEAIGGARELLEFLAARDDGTWSRRLTEYSAAHDLLLAIRDRSQRFEERSQELYAEIARLKHEVQEMEAEKGDIYRGSIKPLREKLWELSQQGVTEGEAIDRIQAEIEAHETPRAELEHGVRERQARVRELDAESKTVRKARMENEKGREASEARRTIAAVEREAERALLGLVRSAFLVTRGLPQSNLRPSAWWFPLADPSGGWFEHLVHAMELRFEPLSPIGPTPAAPA